MATSRTEKSDEWPVPVELKVLQEQKAKYNQVVDRYKSTINKHYLRKEQKEAFECGAECCSRSGTGSVREFHLCQDRCYDRADDQRDYARARFAATHRNFKKCIRRCRKYAKHILATEKDHPQDVEDGFIACVDFCIEQNTFNLLTTVKEVAQDLKSKFG